jgi:hypothetical protein
MSNFKLGYPTIQNRATVTSSHSGNEEKLAQGSRSDRFELASETSDCITLNYDLGLSTSTSDFLAIMRAKLLAGSGCSGVRLRGSAQSAFTSLTPNFHIDGNRGATTTSTRTISAITNYGTAGGTASQGTAANRPLLTGASNLENYVPADSEDSAAIYTYLERVGWTANSTTAPDGTLTADKLTETATTGVHIGLRIGYTFTAGQQGYSVFLKPDGRTWISLRYYDGTTSYLTRFNLAGAGAVGTSASGNIGSIELSTEGFYRCTIERLLPATGSGQFGIELNTSDGSGSESYAGDGTSGVFVWGSQLRRSSTSSTYIRRSTSPIIAGLQGNRGMVFDGSNDSLGTSLAVNPTGGMWGMAVITCAAYGSGGSIMRALPADATNRFVFNVNNDGSVSVQMWNGTGARIGRISAASAVALNTPTVLSWTYDGGTAASGVKIYKNGIQIDTGDVITGSYTVPTAGATLTIGGVAAAYYNGTIYEAIFAQGSTITDGDRQAEEARLTTKYLTTPLASIDFPTTYNGGNSEDYLTTFTESAAYKHYWLQFNTETTSKFKVAKAFFGKALDLGREPLRPTTLNYTRDQSHNREAAYSVDINLDGVLDTPKEIFLNEVIANCDYQPIVAIDEDDLFLNGTYGFHAKITNHEVTAKNTVENNINFTLEEEI